jgi:hypothetical protein
MLPPFLLLLCFLLHLLPFPLSLLHYHLCFHFKVKTNIFACSAVLLQTSVRVRFKTANIGVGFQIQPTQGANLRKHELNKQKPRKRAKPPTPTICV